MGLKGVKVNGQAYHFDHEYLENNPPELPDADRQGGLLLTTSSGGEPFWSSLFGVLTDGLTYSSGDVLTISDHLEWKAISSSDDLPSHSISDRGKCLAVDDYGDLVWRRVESSQDSGLPSYSASDSGKCLTVDSYGDLEWTEIEIPQGDSLPSYSSLDSGRVLAIDDYGYLEWREISEGLPSYSSVNPGSFLVIDSFGEPNWDSVTPGAVDETTIANALGAAEEAYENGRGMVLATSGTGSYIAWTSIADLLEYLPYNDSGDGRVLMYDGNNVYWSNV